MKKIISYVVLLIIALACVQAQASLVQKLDFTDEFTPGTWVDSTTTTLAGPTSTSRLITYTNDAGDGVSLKVNLTVSGGAGVGSFFYRSNTRIGYDSGVAGTGGNGNDRTAFDNRGVAETVSFTVSSITAIGQADLSTLKFQISSFGMQGVVSNAANAILVSSSATSEFSLGAFGAGCVNTNISVALDTTYATASNYTATIRFSANSLNYQYLLLDGTAGYGLNTGVQFGVIPEPASGGLLGMAVCGLLLYRRMMR